MPNIKSSEKDIHRSRKRTLANATMKSRIRRAIRRFQAALETNPEEAPGLLREAESLLDKAATKGVIHRNLASRKKSRLSRRLEKALAAQRTA